MALERGARSVSEKTILIIYSVWSDYYSEVS